MVAVRITRIRARSPSPVVRVSRLHAFAAQIDPQPPATTGVVRITRIRALASPPVTGLQARAGADQSVQGFATVTLNGTGSVGATTLTWTQLSGPAVTLAGTGGTRTFTAPTSATGVTLVFQLAAVSALGTSVDTVSITALPWLHWRWNGTAAVPERAFFK